LTRGYQLCILKEEGPPSGKLDDPDCGTDAVFRLMNGFNILPFAHRINHKKVIQMASAIPYMPFYPSDYLSDTQHLTTQEHGAYFLLILNYWQRGCPLEDNDRKLSSIVKMDQFDWAEVRLSLEEFFEIKGGLWHHKRVDLELRRVKARATKASTAGKASARKRLNINDNPTVVQRSFNPSSTWDQQPFNHTDTDTDTDTGFLTARG